MCPTGVKGAHDPGRQLMEQFRQFESPRDIRSPNCSYDGDPDLAARCQRSYRPAVVGRRCDAVRARVLAGVVAATAGLACGCSAATPSADPIGLTIFSSPPTVGGLVVRGTTLDGIPFSLSSLRGHVVVVNVWASWCHPCRSESAVMAAAARRFARDGVRFVGVDEHDGAGSGRSFSAAAGEHYPQLFDPHGQVLSQLSELPQMGIPSTLVLDRLGRPAARVIGPASRPVLDRAVRAVMGRR